MIWRYLDKVSPQSFQRTGKLATVKPKFIRLQPLLILLTFIFFRSTLHAGLSTYIPIYYVNYLNGSPIYAGYLLSLFLIGGVFGTFVGAMLSDKFGRKTILTFSMVIVLPMVAAIPFTSGVLTMILLVFTGFSLISSFATTLVLSQEMMPGYEGMASGLTIGLTIGLGGVGVTGLGYIADLYGVPAVFSIMPVFPLIGFLLSFLLPGRLLRRDV